MPTLTKLDQIKKGFAAAQELYIALLGAQSDLADVQDDSAVKKAKAVLDATVQEAQQVYSAVLSAHQDHVASAQAAVAKAEADLRQLQTDLKTEHGIEINLLAAQGGATRL